VPDLLRTAPAGFDSTVAAGALAGSLRAGEAARCPDADPAIGGTAAGNAPCRIALFAPDRVQEPLEDRIATAEN
jgi:hypothetical protein